MKNKFMLFTKARDLAGLINQYFIWIKGAYHTELLPFKLSAKAEPEMREQKVWDREPEPATLTGLAHFLGFDSRDAFEQYEQHGAFKKVLKRAHLKIEAEYEKQLSTQPSTGAIFALKCLGWTDKTISKPTDVVPLASTFKIEIINSGPVPAAQEQEVAL